MRIYSVNLNSKTAGLSTKELDDSRVEIFFAGCQIAMNGYPCKGCFNSALWNFDNGFENTPEEVIDYIVKNTDNRYVTIVGGEPADQPGGLTLLCKLLSERGFHIVLISHYDLHTLQNRIPEIFKYINILIDGPYEADKRIFSTDTRRGIRDVVGSSNQKLWYISSHGAYDISDAPEEVLRDYYTKRS